MTRGLLKVNPPRGGDAKPPVWRTKSSKSFATTAGLPATTYYAWSSEREAHARLRVKAVRPPELGALCATRTESSGSTCNEKRRTDDTTTTTTDFDCARCLTSCLQQRRGRRTRRPNASTSRTRKRGTDHLGKPNDVGGSGRCVLVQADGQRSGRRCAGFLDPESSRLGYVQRYDRPASGHAGCRGNRLQYLD